MTLVSIRDTVDAAPRPELSDAADAPIRATAMAAGAQYVVSNNVADFPPRWDTPGETLRLVLDDFTGATHAHFGFDLAGLSLQTTDINRSLGTGTSTSGRAEDLALVMWGRHLPVGWIQGPASGEGRDLYCATTCYSGQ